MIGFRAPGGSIRPDCAWAFDVLREQGYRYDASICPGVSSHGGYPSPFSGPHRIQCNAGYLDEIPSSTTPVGTRRIPYAGGGYLRLFPYPLIRHCIGRDNQQGNPATVYVHPREIDTKQPRMDLPLIRRIKYYVGLASTEGKLTSLLDEHTFVSARTYIERHADRWANQILDVRQEALAEPLPNPALVPPPPDIEPGSHARTGLDPSCIAQKTPPAHGQFLQDLGQPLKDESHLPNTGSNKPDFLGRENSSRACLCGVRTARGGPG